MEQKDKYKFTYKTYGLILKSQLEIDELPAIEDEVDGDVFIEYGNVPRYIKDPIIDSEYTKANKVETYFYIEGVAHFYVCNGDTIIIEPDFTTVIEKQKIYVLGGALGMILTQRNTIGIHGSTTVVDGKGIIVTGQTGAGKSTLSTAISLEGYKLVSDDVSALGKDEKGNVVVYPAYPRQKLCGDTMKKMGFDLKDFKLIDVERDKYSIPVDKCFLNNETKLNAVFEIEEDEVKKVEVSKIEGVDKIKLLLRNIYGVEITRYIGFDDKYFKSIVEVASNVPCFKVRRPKNEFTVGEQIKVIKESLQSLD